MNMFPTFLHIVRLALAAILLSATVAEAQSPGGGGSGRQRGGGADKSGASRGPSDGKTTVRGTLAVDPIAAINRELPSLKMDMKISPEQTALWEALSAAVREANNISINRIKREVMSRLRDDTGKTDAADAPSALVMIAALADDDAQRAEAMRAVTGQASALVEALTPEQRRMFDRRIAQAQREPLGGF